ncbi:MAG: copper homeostasis protein CutC [Bacteroidales bacterium]|nr:copper homeostasis protein CutC [Bacteroidales bacterium]
MNNRIKLEVCVDSLESAILAQRAGAYRLELCNSLIEGGITPSYALIKYARELNIRLNVLIRPRGGDFYYSDDELKVMKEDIRICGELGCDGVVIGMLNVDGTVDMKRNKILIDEARKYSMSVTFHRAFDRTKNLFEALDDVIALKCDRILTSGGYNSAIEGAGVIRKLIRQAEDRIIIMPGAGITRENVVYLFKETGFKEVHGTFRSQYNSFMEYRNTELGDQQEEYTYMHTDPEKVQAVLLSLR